MTERKKRKRQKDVASAQNIFRFGYKVSQASSKRSKSVKKIIVKVEKGQIWTTDTEVKDRLGKVVHTVPMAVPVMICNVWENDVVRVLPLSFDIDFRYGFESVILKLSRLGSVLAEIFNERPMLAGNLGECRDSAGADDLKRISEAREKFLDGYRETLLPDNDYLEWRKKEIELAKYLTLPVNLSL